MTTEESGMVPLPDSLQAPQVHFTFLTHGRRKLTKKYHTTLQVFGENTVNQCRKCSQDQALETLPVELLMMKGQGKNAGIGWLGSW